MVLTLFYVINIIIKHILKYFSFFHSHCLNQKLPIKREEKETTTCSTSFTCLENAFAIWIIIQRIHEIWWLNWILGHNVEKLKLKPTSNFGLDLYFIHVGTLVWLLLCISNIVQVQYQTVTWNRLKCVEMFIILTTQYGHFVFVSNRY